MTWLSVLSVLAVIVVVIVAFLKVLGAYVDGDIDGDRSTSPYGGFLRAHDHHEGIFQSVYEVAFARAVRRQQIRIRRNNERQGNG